MGQYSGANQWVDNIYQFEETDVVQGGPNGIDNKPLKDLADRTAYLYNQLGMITNLSGEKIITGNGSISVNEQGKFIVGIAQGVNTLTIADAGSFIHGALIPISSYCSPNTVFNISCSAGQKIYDFTGVRDKMYMHHKEHLVLIALTDHFKVVSASGNFYCAGEEIKGRKEIINTIALKGQLLSRALYPRLWEYVQSLTLGQEVTNEATYFYDGITYRGLFTIGDGATTFRLPDERGLFERMTDAGRGLDISRGHNYPGGYETDELIYHGHTTEQFSRRGCPKSSGDRDYSYYFIDKARDSVLSTLGVNATGGNETRPKNIGKLNLIKY